MRGAPERAGRVDNCRSRDADAVDLIAGLLLITRWGWALWCDATGYCFDIQ